MFSSSTRACVSEILALVARKIEQHVDAIVGLDEAAEPDHAVDLHLRSRALRA
jgi:hypothetical protein